MLRRVPHLLLLLSLALPLVAGAQDRNCVAWLGELSAASSHRMLYARDGSGTVLPVIDYSSADFSPSPPTPFQVARTRFLLDALAHSPQWVRGGIARHSPLLANLLGKKPFVTGPITYIAKIPPRSFGKSKEPGSFRPSLLDRFAMRSPQAVEAARRGKTMAELGAWALKKVGHGNDEPITLVNIAGGPSADSINALALSERAPLLTSAGTPKALTLHVLDADTNGPTLAESSLKGMQLPGQPLEGVPVGYSMTSYDWNEPRPLVEALRNAPGKVVAFSEGGLFEYGSDEAVLANLRALHEAAPSDAIVLGSVFRSSPTISPVVPAILKLNPKMHWQLRGVEGLELLAREAGWQLVKVDEGNSIYQVFALEKLP